MAEKPFKTEADLCRAFIDWATAPLKDGRRLPDSHWIAYPETAGFDILMHRPCDGAQIGIEAKLRLNPDVIAQVINRSEPGGPGPDYRAVLIPAMGNNDHWQTILRHVGVTPIVARSQDYRALEGVEREWCFRPDLPKLFRPGALPHNEDGHYFDARERFEHWPGVVDWPNWWPSQRAKLPDYVPDVIAGSPAPVTLTPWKVKAIKMAVFLEKRGVVQRSHFKSLDLSMSMWTQSGWIVPGARRGEWVKGQCMRDFRNQHPTNFDQIEADFENWESELQAEEQGALL